MNLIFKITASCMAKNKKRTLVTIIGVIISVAMISAVSTISSSFLDLVRQTSIESSGDWHINYDAVPMESIDIIKQREDFEIVSIAKEIGYAQLENPKNIQKPYVYIIAYTPQSIEDLPIRLVEGKFPSSEQEIMLPSSLCAAYADTFHVGENITYDVGKRIIDFYDDRTIDQRYSFQQEHEQLMDTTTRTYTISGIYDDRMLYQSNKAGYDLIQGFTQLDEGMYNVKVNAVNPTNAIYEAGDQLAEQIQSESHNFNSTLLVTYGVNQDNDLMFTLYGVIAIVALIILIGSVSLIYNAFAISLGERSRYLGMLSSIGATKQQKRNSVFYEAFIIGCIAIPIGFLAGYLGMWITFACVDDLLLNTLLEKSFGDVHLRLIFDFKWFIFALIFAILILVISAWKPARKASKISPIDAIRQSEDTQMNRKHIKTLSITRKLFGFEAELGLKNMKRNHSRYLTTLCSLIISIVLFLSVSSFQMMLQKSFTMTTQNLPGNIQIRTNQMDTSPQFQSFINELLHVEGASSANAVSRVEFFNTLDPSLYSSQLKDYLQENEQMLISLNAYDDVTMKQFCEDIDIDCTKLQTDELEGIIINQVIYRNAHDYQEVELLNVQAGDVLPFTLYNGKMQQEETKSLTIAGVSKQAPPFISNKVESLDGINIIVSLQSLNALIQEIASTQSGMLGCDIIIQADDPFAVEHYIQEILEQYPQYSTYLMNYDRIQQQQNKMILFVSVFLYGFVTLIMLISCANIFNTISTGMVLRKQEFAMLKSVGITPKGFRKMLMYENLFYGIKALGYGIPISCLFSFCLYKILERNFSFSFFLPWHAMVIAIIAVMTLILITMMYAIHKVKDDNIIETIKNETI